MKNLLKCFALALVAILTVACDKKEEAPYIPPQSQFANPLAPAPVAPSAVAPVVVQAAPAPSNGFDAGDALIGAAAGYMIGNSMGSRPQAQVVAPAPTIINRTVINKTYVQAPPAPKVAPAPIPTPTPKAAPVSKPTYRPAPTTRSYSYRPSGRR